GKLADLRPLQLVDLAADPGERPADQREHLGELGRAVPGGEPGEAGTGQAELGPEPGPYRQAAPAVVDQAARPAAKLADQPAGRALRQPVQMAPDLIGPGRGLPAEGHRAARLAVGAPGHDR